MAPVTGNSDVIYSSNSSLISIDNIGQIYLNENAKISDIVNISAAINNLILWRVFVVSRVENIFY